MPCVVGARSFVASPARCSSGWRGVAPSTSSRAPPAARRSGRPTDGRPPGGNRSPRGPRRCGPGRRPRFSAADSARRSDWRTAPAPAFGVFRRIERRLLRDCWCLGHAVARFEVVENVGVVTAREACVRLLHREISDGGGTVVENHIAERATGALYERVEGVRVELRGECVDFCLLCGFIGSRLARGGPPPPRQPPWRRSTRSPDSGRWPEGH